MIKETSVQSIAERQWGVAVAYTCLGFLLLLISLLFVLVGLTAPEEAVRLTLAGFGCVFLVLSLVAIYDQGTLAVQYYRKMKSVAGSEEMDNA